MNKKILALAIAGAMVAPLAAQAEVKIYGRMHFSAEWADADNNVARNDDGINLSSNSSRVGFKGSEDLGNGLSAIWQVESKISLDEGTDGRDRGWALRNSYVGLSGNWGTLIGGKHDTPFKIVGRKLDVFGDTIGDSRNVLGADYLGNNRFNLRTNNTVAYISPAFNGFQVIGAYSSDPGTGDPISGVDNKDAKAWDMAVNYENGPLYIGAAYEYHDDDNCTDCVVLDDAKGFRVGASYKFQTGTKVGGLFEYFDTHKGDPMHEKGWGVFLAQDFGGNNTVKIQYNGVDEADVDSIDNTDAYMLAIGLDHRLSKRTTIYAAYARTENQNSALYTIGGGGHGDTFSPSPGGDPQAFALGVIHNF